MNAPPLPEHFGNYALGEAFTEVATPPAVSWLPATSGWAVLGTLLALFLLYRGGRALRRWHRDRYRREARRELQRLAAGADDALPAAASELLKRTALVAFPRPRVAGLHGSDWVAFLNRHCEDQPFRAEAAAALAHGQYRGEPLPAAGREALLAACDTWIRHHRGPADA